MTPPARIRTQQTEFGVNNRVTRAPDAGLNRDEHGQIHHAELQLGDGVIMFGRYGVDGFLGGSAPDPRAGTVSLYIAVADPDEPYARATAAGAEVVRELADIQYGSREFSVRDPEGNLWSFGTYNPHDR